MDNHTTSLVPVDGTELSTVPIRAEARNKHFSISDLPREVRDIVWRFVVVIPKFYWEAMRVYYLENSFLFCTDDDGYLLSGVRQALDFLRDRPALALQYIRHIELDISDYTSAGGRFTSTFLDSYTDFVTFVTCNMRLRHLTLHIRVQNWDRLFAGFSSWKHLAELYKMPKVQRLNVKLDFSPARCKSHRDAFSCLHAPEMCGLPAGMVRGLKAIVKLRSNLLENGAELGRSQIHVSVLSIRDSRSRHSAALFEIDNNSKGECLLPAHIDTEDTSTGPVAPIVCDTHILDDKRSYALMRKEFREFGYDYFGDDFDQEDGEDESEVLMDTRDTMVANRGDEDNTERWRDLWLNLYDYELEVEEERC